MIFIIALAAFAATLFGGLLALRLRGHFHLIFGFSAGAVVGVAFFDLMPEALELAGRRHETSFVVSLIGLGFLIYLVLDRMLEMHASHDREEAAGAPLRARSAAGSLSVHSFFDGMGIGLAFQVSPVVGAITAAAVLAHDFSDGINTVSVVIKHGGSRTMAFRWLLVDATAPLCGVASTLFFSMPEDELGLLLALFAGFFLYIGASDLLPESHRSHPSKWTTLATVCGMGVLYAVTRLAGV